MDTVRGLLLILEVLLCSSSIRADSFDLRRPPEDYRYGDFASSEDFVPGWEYAYTEVRTPFYYYHFYAPAYKNSFPESHIPQSGRHDFLSFKISRTPDYIGYVSSRGNPPFSPNVYNDYSSPQFNDVQYPDREIPMYNKGYNTVQFPKTYPSNFKPREPYNYHQHHDLDFRQSLLPSVLSSYLPNIVRKEHQRVPAYNNGFRPYSYAPSFKDHAPDTLFPVDTPPYISGKNPSIFSSALPNIIRDEEKSVNNLFTPKTPTYMKTTTPQAQFPSSNTQIYSPLTSPRTIQEGYHGRQFPSILSSVAPNILSSTLSPTSLQTHVPGFYTLPEGTLTPIFPSTETPLDVYSTLPPSGDPTSLRRVPYETTSPAPPRIVYEAPGRTHPRR